MTAARPEEEGEAFAHALRGDVAKALDLAVLPMPPFPTPAQALPDGGAGPGVHEVSFWMALCVQLVHMKGSLCPRPPAFCSPQVS